jgi:hypothetical protein
VASLRIDLASGPVSASSETVTATFEGTPLAACPATPCAELAPDRIRGHVKGPGMLVVSCGGPLAEVRVSGAKPEASIVIDVRC